MAGDKATLLSRIGNSANWLMSDTRSTVAFPPGPFGVTDPQPSIEILGTNRVVIAGPSEATVAGNILVQAMGAGDLRGLADIRQVVRDSFPVTTHEPAGATNWDAAYARFNALSI